MRPRNLGYTDGRIVAAFAIPNGWTLALDPLDNPADRFASIHLTDPTSSAVIVVHLWCRFRGQTIDRCATYLLKILQKQGYQVESPGVVDSRVGLLHVKRVAVSTTDARGKPIIGQQLLGLLRGSSLWIVASARLSDEDALNASLESFLASWECSDAK